MSTVINKPATTTGDPVVVQPEPERSNLIGLVALGLAILGLIFAALLVTAGIAWMLLFPAIVLGIVGLTRKNRRKGTSLAAVIVAIVALILSFVGFRLPVGMGGATDGDPGILNNSGVNPFSVITDGLTPGGSTGEVGGTTVEGDGGLGVGVTSVDCHTPLATVTGLNITGEVCAVTIAVTNNGSDVVSIDSSSVTANVDGTGYLADADLTEGNLLSVDLGSGESDSGIVYVNLPSGSSGIDSLTVTAGNNSDATVTVDVLGG